MPKLGQLTCNIEWGRTGIPFKEYAVEYDDGQVACLIAIPPTSTPFTVHLKSEGFIAPGLAMFVFVDGVCVFNRNKVDLVNLAATNAHDLSSHQMEIDFKAHQKEERVPGDMWAARAWRFEPCSFGRPYQPLNSVKQVF